MNAQVRCPLLGHRASAQPTETKEAAYDCPECGQEFAAPLRQPGLTPASHVVAPAPPRQTSCASTIGGGAGVVIP